MLWIEFLKTSYRLLVIGNSEQLINDWIETDFNPPPTLSSVIGNKAKRPKVNFASSSHERNPLIPSIVFRKITILTFGLGFRLGHTKPNFNIREFSRLILNRYHIWFLKRHVCS